VLERSLQKSVMGRLKQLALQEGAGGLVFRKRHGTVTGVAGDPDIYGLFKGIHFEIELKRAGENPTKLQDHRMGEWGRAGAVTAVVRSLDDLDRFLAQIRIDASGF
jgi:hypothetical protein